MITPPVCDLLSAYIIPHFDGNETLFADFFRMRAPEKSGLCALRPDLFQNRGERAFFRFCKHGEDLIFGSTALAQRLFDAAAGGKEVPEQAAGADVFLPFAGLGNRRSLFDRRLIGRCVQAGEIFLSVFAADSAGGAVLAAAGAGVGGGFFHI